MFKVLKQTFREFLLNYNVEVLHNKTIKILHCSEFTNLDKWYVGETHI